MTDLDAKEQDFMKLLAAVRLDLDLSIKRSVRLSRLDRNESESRRVVFETLMCVCVYDDM